MAARKKIEDVNDEVASEPVADVIPIDRMTVTPQGDMIEITYSRSWDLAVVQYEKMSVFTSIKKLVPGDSDLSAVGEEISDMLNELQGADLTWARAMCSNRGSLITRIIPE